MIKQTLFGHASSTLVRPEDEHTQGSVHLIQPHIVFDIGIGAVFTSRCSM